MNRMGDIAAPGTADWMAPEQPLGPQPVVPRMPTVAEALPVRMGGLAAMDEYNEAPQAFAAYDKARREEARRARILATPMPGQVERPPMIQYTPETLARDRAMMEFGRDLIVPQTPLDVGLMVAGGPVGGKLLRGGAAALGALFDSDTAEAGGLTKAGKALLRGKPGGPHPGGIMAYHSSPHDFDKFDWSKLRTGEGANVYGAGFYAAESPAVSGQGGQYWQQFLNRFPDAEYSAAERLKAAAFDRAAAVAETQKRIADLKEVMTTAPHGEAFREHNMPLYRERLQRLQARHDLLASGKPVGPRTYEVNIKARPEELLDWDRPLHAQPHMVGPLNKAGFNLSPAVGDLSYLTQKAAVEGPDSWYAAQLRAVGDMRNKTGAEFKPQSAEAAERLRDAGIPGIRYLDQGSRSSGYINGLVGQYGTKENALKVAQQKLVDAPNDFMRKGWQEAIDQLQRHDTYNYVVTDPSKLEIMAKYGIVAGAPIGMGALAMQDDYRQ